MRALDPEAKVFKNSDPSFFYRILFSNQWSPFRRNETTLLSFSPLVQEGVNTERAAARLLYRCNFSANAECRYSKDYTVSAATPGLSRRDGVSAIVGATTRGDGDRLSWPVNFRTGFAATRHHLRSIAITSLSSRVSQSSLKGS